MTRRSGSGKSAVGGRPPSATSLPRCGGNPASPEAARRGCRRGEPDPILGGEPDRSPAGAGCPDRDADPDRGGSSTAMRLLVVSDLHGDLDSARRACDRVRPELILSCGDWGDLEQVDESAFSDLLGAAPVYTTFGNHDPLDRLADLRNLDGSPVLLDQGQTREFAGLRLAAIGGIWAKSHA